MSLTDHLGNFGTVLHATWRGINVALKKQICASDAMTAGFDKEAALLFKMWSVCMFLLGILIRFTFKFTPHRYSHPNIVRMYGGSVSVDEENCVTFRLVLPNPHITSTH